MILFGSNWTRAGNGWGYPTNPGGGGGGGGTANAFVIDPGWQNSNTKFYFDVNTNAHGDVGTNNWTVTDLANALNAQAGGAPAPYTATVWAADVANNAVVVTAGPIPATLELVSVPASIPVTAV